MDKATFLEKSDKYIDGLLSNEERKHFIDMVNNNIDLKKEFEDHLLIRKGIKTNARKDLRNELFEIKKSIKHDNNKVRFLQNINIYWKAIAAIFIGIIAVYFVFKTDTEINSDFQYAGKYTVRILPKEGNLGAPLEKNWNILLRESSSQSYYINEDTIKILMDGNKIKEFNAMKPSITIQGNQELKIQINNNIYYLNKIKN